MNPLELRQKFHNLATAKTPWYKFVNLADLDKTEIHIFNSIGLGVMAEDFCRELDDIKGPVEVHMNCEGGEIFQAKAIYNALSRRNDVTVIVDGLAASAASFIAMAASPQKLFMSRIGTMMIHDGQTMAYGSAAELRGLVDALDRESDTIAGIYAERTGKPATYWRDKMRLETWYNAEQALEEGLCDGIYDPRTNRLTNSVRNAAAVPYVSERQTRHEPMTGRHSHDHAAFEAGDHDDGVHLHTHEHHNDADHHHTHTAGMGHEGDMHTDHDTAMVGHSHLSIENIILADSFPEAEFYNRTFTEDQRKKAAARGDALSDGSYPIENCEDADNARTAYGRAPEGKRSAVAAHIRKRESALKCKTEPFKPGSDNSLDVTLTDEEVAAFAATIRL